MAKKRKTRLQKMQAAKRHHDSVNTDVSSTPARENLTTFSVTSLPFHPSPKISTTDYTVVKHDLIRTLIITSAIIVAEFILFFLLK